MTLRSFCRANFRFSSIWSVFGGQERDRLAYHLFSYSLCGRESAGLEEQVSLWCKIKMLFEIIQYIVSLHISSGNCSQMESHTLVSLVRFSCWWIHGMWAKGKRLSASQQEKAPRACGKSPSLPSWSHTNPAASGKLFLKSLATCWIQYLLCHFQAPGRSFHRNGQLWRDEAACTTRKLLSDYRYLASLTTAFKDLQSLNIKTLTTFYLP